MAVRQHRSRTRPRPPRRLAVVALLLVAASTGACSSGGGAKPISARSIAGDTTSTSAGHSSTTSTTLTTTPGEATTTAILAGYRAEDAAFLDAAEQDPVNPSDPRLPATMTGAELVAVSSRLTQARFQGQYLVGTVDLAPVVTGTNFLSATLSDCVFDHTRIMNARTGQTVSGPDTQRTLEHAALQWVDGVWKVASYVEASVGCKPGDV